MSRKPKKKKWHETAEYRFQRDTKDYDECVKRNTWRTERKVADEILAATRLLRLSLSLDRLTEYRYNSFPIAILQQLRRKAVYDHLDIESKKLADRMDTKYFRKKVVNFVESLDSEKILAFQDEYVENSFSEEDSWEKELNRYLNPTWAPNWYVQATAWFLKLDIHVVVIDTKENWIDQVSGAYGKEDEKSQEKRMAIGPLFIGRKTDITYQSLLPSSERKAKTEDFQMKNDAEGPNYEGSMDTLCPICQGFFQYILKHLRKGSPCTGKISEDLLEKFRKEAKIRNKETNRINSALYKKRQQGSETFEEREQRLTNQAKSMYKLRIKRLHADFFHERKMAKESKAKSRLKQKEIGKYVPECSWRKTRRIPWKRITFTIHDQRKIQEEQWRLTMQAKPIQKLRTERWKAEFFFEDPSI